LKEAAAVTTKLINLDYKIKQVVIFVRSSRDIASPEPKRSRKKKKKQKKILHLSPNV